jgi:hypothetical protein
VEREIKVTVTIGVAQLGGEDVAALLARADQVPRQGGGTQQSLVKSPPQ